MIITKKIDLIDETKTINLGKKLALDLKNQPALIFLRGEMGGGKTTLAQGFIKSLVKDIKFVQSPTYCYAQSYHHLLPIYHLDLYRIEEPGVIQELGLDIYIDDQASIRLIEWPERMGDSIRRPDIDILLTKNNECRKAVINYHNPSLMLDTHKS